MLPGKLFRETTKDMLAWTKGWKKPSKIYGDMAPGEALFRPLDKGHAEMILQYPVI